MNAFSVETIWLGINNLRLHKLRSLLTSLGIIFGVAAVICMLSVSEGVTADELRMIQQLGTRNIIVTSVKPPVTRQVAEGNSTMLTYGITYADRELIAATIPNIRYLVPLKTIAHRVRRHDRQIDAKTIGTTPEYFQAVNVEVLRGRLLGASDDKEIKSVCVIGDTIRRELFTFEDPIGKSIFVQRREGTTAFTVVGILKPVQTAGAPRRGVVERNINSEIYIPYKTATTRYGDINVLRTSGSEEVSKTELSGIYVSVDELEHVLPVSEMVSRVFTHSHKKQDFDIRVPLRSLQLAERKKRNSQLLLGFIAGISLLVGGIGIMNIMLATVTERTREIGIRRALGARQIHITMQFLVETIVLSTTGGLCGILLGYLGSKVISQYAGWGDAIVQPWAILISFGLSVMTGIFFGLWPAIKAAQLDPIEALRYE